MPFAQSNGIELCYETFGDQADPALLLIMGVGEQLLEWPEGFCLLLVDRGFHVIRFDNRDVGLSTWFDHVGDVDLAGLARGDFSTVHYGLPEMATDAAGLLDALGIERAHLVGASMGGGIAQLLAIDSPGRVASLASIMASTSNRQVGGSTLENPIAMVPMPGDDRDKAVALMVEIKRALGSPASAEDLTREAEAKYDRAFHPAGMFRQIAANAIAADRTEQLRELTVPTVVIHGEDDPLTNVSGGRAVAEAVPGAELLVIPGMGHDLPEREWTRVTDAIAANAARA